MKRKLLAFAILTAFSAGAMAAGTYQQSRAIGPQTAVPDNSTIVTEPSAVIVPAEPSASTGSSAAYATPANPPVATPAAPVATAPVVDSKGRVVANAAVVPAQPMQFTQTPGQSGPGANDKLRPGQPDDESNHSSWDVGTSSAGG